MIVEKLTGASCARVKSVVRRDDMIKRLGGDAWIPSMTWTDDDRQLVSVCDGSGWPENADRYYSSSLLSVSGDPENAEFHHVPSYPSVPMWEIYAVPTVPYYSPLGMLAVDGCIYQYLSTWDHWVKFEERQDPSFTFTGAKLIYSPDNGRTWCNGDGSTPVVRESFGQQSRENMVFRTEQHDAFSLLTFLQMGKGYQDNRDGYVYVYSPNGRVDGKMNELVMFRVHKSQIRHREAYEFFGGSCGDGSADWVNDLNARVAVHTFPRGLIPPYPVAWLPSVVYNAALGLYVMANSNGVGVDTRGYKPSYFGIWTAPQPWGPWSQIHEEVAWTPGGDLAVRGGAPVIAPKWISKDGRSFWLVFWDVQTTTSEDTDTTLWNAPNEEEFNRRRSRWRQFHPNYAFNVQRFDLVVT